MPKKKILILGGANVHCKLVHAAHKLGMSVYVTDYLTDSPAKAIADRSYMLDVKDINGIVNLCKEEKIDAVLSTHLDPCQRPYQEICERLHLPCFSTRDQVYKLTDKRLFKELCQSCNVDTIPDYSVSDVLNDHISYPVFIKPSDSRGSRGQAVCYSKEDAVNAIAVAQSESSDGNVIIEKYLKSAPEIQVTYFFINGEAHLIRTADSYSGLEEDGLEKVVQCAVSPSRFTQEYLRTTNDRVIAMFKSIGIQNGPVFMQGFYDDGAFRFFDPGHRFPGVEYDMVYPKVCGTDILELMIQFAVCGHFPESAQLPQNIVTLNDHYAAVLFPTITAGQIRSVHGIGLIRQNPVVVAYSQRHEVGDCLDWTYNVNQRFAEIDVLCDSRFDLEQTIAALYNTLKVNDSMGNDMVFRTYEPIPWEAY